MKIIVGLGNPGDKYKNTRHNVGFKVLDLLANDCGESFHNEAKFKAEICKVNISGESVLLVKPQTFMNLSGDSLALLMNFYKLTIDDLLVVFDDLSIELGNLRFRANGSDGGHNGIKSIIKCLSNNNKFARLKVGVGPQPPYMPAEKFVLGDFTKEESSLLQDVILVSANAVKCYIKNGINEAQNKFNGTIN